MGTSGTFKGTVGQTGFIKIRGGHVRDIPRLGQTGFIKIRGQGHSKLGKTGLIKIRGGHIRDIPRLGQT